jgi:hypothetical protein
MPSEECDLNHKYEPGAASPMATAVNRKRPSAGRPLRISIRPPSGQKHSRAPAGSRQEKIIPAPRRGCSRYSISTLQRVRCGRLAIRCGDRPIAMLLRSSRQAGRGGSSRTFLHSGRSIIAADLNAVLVYYPPHLPFGEAFPFLGVASPHNPHRSPRCGSHPLFQGQFG